MKEEIKITKKDYSKWWTVTQFDVGRKLGHPDYIDSIDRQLESLREAARAVVEDAVVGSYRGKCAVCRCLIDQLAERLEALDD